jgi:iron complex outermembrane receptor protein
MKRLLPAVLAAAPALCSGGGRSAAESVLFESPPVVETAALYAQTLQEAPASVTVITRDQIRRYGWRTLAEALAHVRGVYISYDGELYYAGVRGFSLPGDYNTRTLVMLNGHYLTDNVYGAMYMFGQDFGLDMDLVERIEIVRGPSSALYGSNGMLATINIYTRAPADWPRAALSVEWGSFGQKKAFVSSACYLGRGANLLLAASAFHARGRWIDGAGLGGLATGSVGAEQGYHSFAQLTWRSWSVTANFHGRRGLAPAGWYGSDFGDTGTSSRDAHNFIEAAWRRPVGQRGELEWRFSYDQFRYRGRYDYTTDSTAFDERDWALGDWVGSRLAYRRSLGRLGEVTLGS